MVREWKIEEERLRLQKTDKELSKNRAILGTFCVSRLHSKVIIPSLARKLPSLFVHALRCELQATCLTFCNFDLQAWEVG